MSHFTKVATKIKNLASLEKALAELQKKRLKVGRQEQQMVRGFKRATEGVEVRGWKGQTLKAEISIDMGKYDIGVIKNEDGTYSLEADWWGIETTTGFKEEEVTKELNAAYAYQTVVAAVEEQGYSVDQIQQAEDGSVQLNVSKWG